MNKFYFLIVIVIALFFSCEAKKEVEKEVPLNAETALYHYLNNNDKTYSWELKEKYQVENQSVTAYDLKLTSQQWREHVWTHQLTILVPEEVTHKESLLFVTGGSNKEGNPNFKGHGEEDTQGMSILATKNSSIVAIIRQTPNQPLYDGLVEDQLISFTLHNFKNDGDFTWPLLFPMVKTAIKAMDAIQDFSKKEIGKDISQFVVSGGSKRGWTTWLTGATDDRVMAIAPMVIDVLNMPVSLDYQVEVWKEYSIQIEDYVKLEIPQTASTPEGNRISQMVDPYSYRKSLTMPKMLIIGTIDEYWPVDAIKNYIDSIPGKNLIEYIPNAGHGLGDRVQANQALSSFYAMTINGMKYPECGWKVNESVKSVTITATASSDQLIGASLWYADSEEDRDFRDEEWKRIDLDAKGVPTVDAVVDYPGAGYKAFYIDLKYVDPNGEAYVTSTRMFVVDTSQIL